MMLLFENEGYRWPRDLLRVVSQQRIGRPRKRSSSGSRRWDRAYEVQELRRDEQGLFESLTSLSPDDFAAMDITYIVGEEVQEQVSTLCRRWLSTSSASKSGGSGTG